MSSSARPAPPTSEGAEATDFEFDLPDWARELLIQGEGESAVADLNESTLAELLGALGGAAGQLAPEPSTRERLLEQTGGSLRFAPFTSRLERLFQVDTSAIVAMFERIELPEEWEAFPVPGVELLHVTGGPGTAGADVGFVRLGPGVAFPQHKHLGDERALILSGGYRDAAGREFRAGDISDMHPDSEHAFTAGAQGCLFAVVVYGVEIDGVRIEASGR